MAHRQRKNEHKQKPDNKWNAGSVDEASERRPPGEALNCMVAAGKQILGTEMADEENDTAN